ncbi:amino acid permease-domain-containing protein [Aspergillus stella-maris]|uniref:amino acid permease-domain-containing protein n=1 Tax=Aspergillus stella-maris TaxID=1810926 RepID=UPI003CCCB0D1
MFGIGKEKEIGTTLSPADHDGKADNADPQITGPETRVGGLEFNEYTQGGLGRHLGVFSTILLIVGAALLLWVLGLLLAGSGLAVWLELGCMIPRSGGEKVYLEAAFRRPHLLITVIFAVQAVALGCTASGCIVFASNMVLASGKEASEWEERGIAIGVISFITLLHVFFPNAGVRGMNAIGVIKIVLLVFIVVTGWVVLSGRVSSVQDPYASFHNSFAGSATSSNLYATALFKVLNSFAGWSNAAYVLNEIRDPVRTLKIAAPTGLSICGMLYLLANVAYYAAATPEEIANSGTTVASYFMRKVFGTAAERALSVLVAISAFGNVMTVTFAQARVNQELAKGGVIPFPTFWASSWPFGSPSSGLLLHFIPSLIVIVAIPFGDAYNFILDLEGYPSSIITSSSFWWPVAIFFMAGQAFQVVAPFIRPPGGKGDTSLPYWLYPVVGIVVLLCGVGYWGVWRVLMPVLGGYTLVPDHVALGDGTRVVVYRRVKGE